MDEQNYLVKGLDLTIQLAPLISQFSSPSVCLGRVLHAISAPRRTGYISDVCSRSVRAWCQIPCKHHPRPCSCQLLQNLTSLYVNSHSRISSPDVSTNCEHLISSQAYSRENTICFVFSLICALGFVKLAQSGQVPTARISCYWNHICLRLILGVEASKYPETIRFFVGFEPATFGVAPIHPWVSVYGSVECSWLTCKAPIFSSTHGWVDKTLHSYTS